MSKVKPEDASADSWPTAIKSHNTLCYDVSTLLGGLAAHCFSLADEEPGWPGDLLLAAEVLFAQASALVSEDDVEHFSIHVPTLYASMVLSDMGLACDLIRKAGHEDPTLPCVLTPSGGKYQI